MVITQTDLAGMRLGAGARMSDGEILLDLIRDWQSCATYQRACEGQKYYRGEQDVLQVDFSRRTVEDTQLDDSGREVPRRAVFANPNRSNTKTPHPFFYNHVEQKVSYILGKEPSITTADPALHDALAATTGAQWARLMATWATAASCQGRAWLHEYKDADGTLRQAVVDCLHGVPIYGGVHEQELSEFIYYFPVTEIQGRTRTTRTHAQWWTADGVTHWVGDGQSPFRPDAQRPGAQPHYYQVELTLEADGETWSETGRNGVTWPRLPFIELRNNDECSTDLERYKALIDAYDLISSEGTNNMLDFTEFWAILHGYGGEAASSFIRKLQVNHAVSLNGGDGHVDMKQLSLDMQGRIAWLATLRDSIHEFGMAVDINPERLSNGKLFGSSPSGVAIKFQYTLLDLKANRMIGQLREAMIAHFAFVTEDIARRDGRKFDPHSIDIAFNKSMLANDLETVEMLNQSRGMVPQRILMAAHPLVSDPDAAMDELTAEKKAEG